MVSHKMSLITIFGHKHFRQNFHQKFDIFYEKISTASDFGSYLASNSYFDAKLLQKRGINFEENGSCGQKMLLLKYFKDYII